VVPSPSFRLRHGLVPFIAIALEHVDLLQAIYPVDVNSRNPSLYTMYGIPTFKTNMVREQKAIVHHVIKRIIYIT
jgi:hypothetical protein